MAHRPLAAILAILLLLGALTGALTAAALAADPPAPAPSATSFALPIPYISQLESDSPYAAANCGPASLAMIFLSHGLRVDVDQVRALVNRIQQNDDPDNGTTLETIVVVAQRYGLTPFGLATNGEYNRWTLETIRRELRQGRPVVPQVYYRQLPGHEDSTYNGDHYIVLLGVDGDEFIYHDSAFRNGEGRARRIPAARLAKAMQQGDFPYAAVGIAPARGAAALPWRNPADLIPTPTPRPPTATPPPLPTATPIAVDTPRPSPTAPAPTAVPTQPPLTATAIPAAAPPAPARPAPTVVWSASAGRSSAAAISDAVPVDASAGIGLAPAHASAGPFGVAGLFQPVALVGGAGAALLLAIGVALALRRG